MDAQDATDKSEPEINLKEIRRRWRVLAALRDLVSNKDTTEDRIQQTIGHEAWLFGGQYTGVHERRDGMPLDQHDIVLVRSDRSLHIVELKRPGSRLVKRHRGHLVVSGDVNDAMNQCGNYLRTFDEFGACMQTNHHNELGLDYDYRRARGTVVIGHPMHSDLEGVSREQISQTIRSHNAYHSRVQVLTYDDLLDSAGRALTFSEAAPH